MKLPHTNPGERGSILVVTLLVVLLCTGLLIGLLELGLSTSRENRGRHDRERAFQIAESALNSSLFVMRDGRSGAIADAALPASFGGGIAWVTTEDLSGSLRLATSAAAFGRERVAVAQHVFHFDPDPLAVGVFADRSILIESNCLLDSYDPANGTYADQLALSGSSYANDEILIQTNGDVQVETTTEVYGDLNPGTDGSIAISNNATVTGRTDRMPVSRDMPPEPSPPIASTGNLSVTAPGTSIGPGDFNYGSVLVQNNTDLTVVGPARVIISDWDLRSNTGLHLDTTAGAIEIYFEGDAVFNSNSTITTSTASARDVSFIFNGGGSQVVDLDSNCQFNGTIYAPEASITLSSNFELYGAIVAAELTLDSNSRVHFDESLMTAAPSDRLYFPGRWSPVRFPHDELRTQRVDALRVLGVNPDDVPSLTEAAALTP